jgi:hypothetical protein
MTTRKSDWLEEHAEVKEEPFRSDVAVVGPLLARFRSLWNSVAAKWYVRPLLAQQNQFNQTLVQRLQAVEQRLIEQDWEQTALIHDLAEVSTQLAETNRLLTAIEARLARLEEE